MEKSRMTKKIITMIAMVVICFVFLVGFSTYVQAATTVTSVKVTTPSSKKATVQVKKTYTIKAAVLPADATNQGLSYKSSNKKVATVSSKGVVTAKAVGKATITITAKGNTKKTAKVAITVKPAAKKVNLDKTKASVVRGKTLQLKAKYNPTGSYSKVTWTSSNKSIATVSSSGKVTVSPTAVKGKKVTITAKISNGKTAKCVITVAEQKATSVKINKPTDEAIIGKTLNLTATVSPATTNNKTVTWKSNDSKIAKVNKTTGVVTVVNNKDNIGKTATITATTANGKTATYKITVKTKYDSYNFNDSLIKSLPNGISEEDAIKSLPKTVEVIDKEGNKGIAKLAWFIVLPAFENEVDTDKVYTIAAVITLPSNWLSETNILTIVKSLTVEKAKYTVTFDTNGGTAIDSMIVSYGDKIEEPTEKPTKSGYIFYGWFADSKFKEEVDFDAEITEDTTIYTKWIPQINDVSIKSNNNDTAKATYGDIVTLTFTTVEKVGKLSNFKINGGNPKTFECEYNNDKEVWVSTATYAIDETDPKGEMTFQINVENADGIYSQTIEATTDATKVVVIDSVQSLTNKLMKGETSEFTIDDYVMLGVEPDCFDGIGISCVNSVLSNAANILKGTEKNGEKRAALLRLVDGKATVADLETLGAIGVKPEDAARVNKHVGGFINLLEEGKELVNDFKANEAGLANKLMNGKTSEFIIDDYVMLGVDRACFDGIGVSCVNAVIGNSVPVLKGNFTDLEKVDALIRLVDGKATAADLETLGAIGVKPEDAARVNKHIKIFIDLLDEGEELIEEFKDDLEAFLTEEIMAGRTEGFTEEFYCFLGIEPECFDGIGVSCVNAVIKNAVRILTGEETNVKKVAALVNLIEGKATVANLETLGAVNVTSEIAIRINSHIEIFIGLLDEGEALVEDFMNQ